VGCIVVATSWATFDTKGFEMVFDCVGATSNSLGDFFK
jgi:hypothetical protein